MASYDMFLSGDLANFQVSDEQVQRNTKDLEKLI
jgi:tryptophan synthase beta chain